MKTWVFGMTDEKDGCRMVQIILPAETHEEAYEKLEELIGNERAVKAWLNDSYNRD